MLQIFSISKPIKHLSSLVIVENFKVLIIINERLKKGWTPKNWCFRIVVLEKPLGILLDCKIKPIVRKSVNLKGNLKGNSGLKYQPCIFTGRTNAEAEAPKLWPPPPIPFLKVITEHCSSILKCYTHGLSHGEQLAFQSFIRLRLLLNRQNKVY